MRYTSVSAKDAYDFVDCMMDTELSFMTTTLVQNRHTVGIFAPGGWGVQMLTDQAAVEKQHSLEVRRSCHSAIASLSRLKCFVDAFLVSSDRIKVAMNSST